MSEHSRKIISFALKFLAAAISAFVGLTILGVFVFPSYVLYGDKSNHLRLSSLVTEMVHIKQAVKLYCDGVTDKKRGMKESQRFGYSLISDDKGTRISIYLRDQALKEFSINGQKAQYIDRKLDDGLPESGQLRFSGATACVRKSDEGLSVYDEKYDGNCSSFVMELDCPEVEKANLDVESRSKANTIGSTFEKIAHELLIISTDDIYRDGWAKPRKIDFEERRKFFTPVSWIDYKKFVDRQKRLMQQRIAKSETEHKKFLETLKQQDQLEKFNSQITNKVGKKCVANLDTPFQIIDLGLNEKKATANGRFMFGAYDSHSISIDPKDKFSLEIEFYQDPQNTENFKIKKWNIQFKDEGI